MGEPTNTYQKKRILKSDTEGGMNKQEKVSVLSWEAKNRNGKTESVAVFDKNGHILYENRNGNSHQVKLSTQINMENAIISHNHPGASFIGDGLAKNVGSSFSGNDIRSAIRMNAKEIRAVTPNYTYSIRRPKSGWGKVDADKIKEIMDNDFFFGFNGNYEYVHEKGIGEKHSRNRQDRTLVAYANEAVRKQVKKYSWIYTRRRNK